MTAAVRLVAIISLGYLIGFWVIRSGGNVFEACVFSLIITTLVGTIGAQLEDADDE